MINDIITETRTHMQKAIESVQHEMALIRTGRATTNLLDVVRVEYYGTHMPVNQVATIGVPEPRLLTIQPWDKSAISAIEKAILASGLGLTPSNDGTLIRLPIPQLTEERRKDLVRVVHKLAEEGRVSIRNARRDANEMLKEGEKEGEIPEDDCKKAQKQVQDLTDEYIKKVDEILKRKEADIMEV
ncbi:MAG: ribosome recycling factor [Candidatus Latescibacteria bacterium]|nr:ribosome recycling factor [Candidatus Latescibacterota bacterium]